MPSELAVHLVLDNSSTHKTAEIQRWLLAHPRFVLHFTPTSSSWLNLVERWFAELTTEKLRRSTHRSVSELNADIRTWIETWNENPRPYVWTRTADEILDSITRYCERITGSGHEHEQPHVDRLLVVQQPGRPRELDRCLEQDVTAAARRAGSSGAMCGLWRRRCARP